MRDDTPKHEMKYFYETQCKVNHIVFIQSCIFCSTPTFVDFHTLSTIPFARLKFAVARGFDYQRMHDCGYGGLKAWILLCLDSGV